MLANLTRLPRLAKLLILLSVDGLIGVVAFWAASFLRLGKFPAYSSGEALVAVAVAGALVPLAGLAFGMYRPVVRFAIPSLSTRAILVSVASGAVIGVLGGIGGASYPRAFGLAGVFALVVFAMLVLSRHAARGALYARERVRPF